MIAEEYRAKWEIERVRHEDTQRRLAEATALLERVQRKGPTRGDGALNGDIKAFLYRAPDPAGKEGA